MPIKGREEYARGFLNAFVDAGYSVHEIDNIVQDMTQKMKDLGLSRGAQGQYPIEAKKWEALLDKLPKELAGLCSYYGAEYILPEINKWTDSLNVLEMKKKKAKMSAFINKIPNARIQTAIRKAANKASEFKEKIQTTALYKLISSGFGFELAITTLFAIFGRFLIHALTGKDMAAILGPIPLGSWGPESPCMVEEIEIAHSNKVVKFRAVGSVFLAHQGGAKDSVKITGILRGDNAKLYFLLFWVLTALSSGTIEASEAEVLSDPLLIRAKCGNITDLRQIGEKIVEIPKEKKHWTFPLVTRHTIIPNCYIETFSFEETLEHGKDVIAFDLLLRTYEKSEKLYQYGNTVGSYTASKLKRPLEYFANLGYRTYKFYEESIDNKTWKVNNYYDVDPLDVAVSAGLSTIVGVFA